MRINNSVVRPVDACCFKPWTVRVFVCVFVIFVFYMNVLSSFNHDELEAVHSAWKMNQGERIYADFFQHHHPLLYIYLGPVIALCGEHAATVLACRIAILPFFSGIVAATWLLTQRLFDQRTALVAVACLLLSWPFLCVATEIRPDVPQVMFGMFALVLLYPRTAGQPGKASETGQAGAAPLTLRRCLLIGLCLGVSFLFLQKALFYMAAVTFIVLGRVFRREADWKAVFALGAGIVLAVLPFGIWLAAHGMVREYIFLNWTLNAHNRDQFSFVFDALVILKTLSVTCAFALLALTVLWFERRERELALVLAILFGQVLLAPSPYLQYWTPLLPMFAIYAAHGLIRVLGRRPAILSGLLAATAIVPVIVEIHPGDMTNWGNLDRIAYVLKMTGPSESVYDGDAVFNVFRKDVDYFWYSLGRNQMLATYRALRRYDFDLYARIETMKPKIISTWKIENLDDARIRDHYTKSDRYPALWIRTR